MWTGVIIEIMKYILLNLLFLCCCSCILFVTTNRVENIGSHQDKTDIVMNKPSDSLLVDIDGFTAYLYEFPSGQYLERTVGDDTLCYEYVYIDLSVLYKEKVIVDHQIIGSSYFELIPDKSEAIVNLHNVADVKKDTLIIPLGFYYPDSDCGYHIRMKVTPNGEVMYSYEIASGGLEGNGHLDLCESTENTDSTTSIICSLEDSITSDTIYSSGSNKIREQNNIFISQYVQIFVEHISTETDNTYKVLVYDKMDRILYQTEIFNVDSSLNNELKVSDVRIADREIDVKLNHGNIKTLNITSVNR